MNKSLNEIYKEVDLKLTKNYSGYAAYIKSLNGKYKYFSECLVIEKQTKTDRQIAADIVKAGFKSPNHSYVWRIRKMVEDRLKKAEPIKEGAKICYMCLKYPVAEGNHALCAGCDKKSKSGSFN